MGLICTPGGSEQEQQESTNKSRPCCKKNITRLLIYLRPNFPYIMIEDEKKYLTVAINLYFSQLSDEN